jgi:serine/threonine protein kinase/predicted ATPase
MMLAGNRRFELRRELGRGGMGVVYEAFDTERQQPVALKMLHRRDPETIVLLKQEFRSLCEISHPNLIAMYELLGDQQDWFFTMEFVRDGRNFMECLRERMGQIEIEAAVGGLEDSTPDQLTLPARSGAAMSTIMTWSGDEPALDTSPAASPDLTMDQLESIGKLATIEQPRMLVQRRKRLFKPDQIQPVVDLFRQLAEGVQGLHAQGKLHRDLKPGNVMVRADSSVVILDFGLVAGKARSAGAAGAGASQSGSGSSDSDGMVVGTIAYMAPEQAAGQPLTEASDWYAVGIMLFEALTGQLPFQGSAMTLLRAKQLSEAPNVTSFVDGAPPEITALCNGLLRRYAAARPAGTDVLATLGAKSTLATPAPEHTAESFIGREEYLARLDSAFTRSRAAAAIVHLRGRSGTGKSAIMAQFIHRLCEHATPLVFRSRCYEQESVPYKTMDGLADEIAHWLAQRQQSEQRAYMPSTAHALAQIFPVFKRVPCIAAATHAERTTDLEQLRRQSFEALGELLRRIGNAYPLVLCVDDLQWGDADGVAMLALALSQPSIRLLLLVTFREEYTKTSSSLRALLEFEAQAHALDVEDIAVKALNREESLELARRRSPGAAAEDLEEIVRQAEGNPYFLEELAHHSAAGRSLSAAAGLKLDAILWNRIERLSAPELRLLETIAVSGQPIRVVYAQEAAELRAAPASLLTSLRMHHLVRSSGSGLQDEVETYHDRIRETVLEHLSRDQRRARHASLAFCLEASGKATSDTLAVHFEAGDQPEKAGHFYELAAQESANALAFSRAEEFYKKARRLVVDPAAQTRITQRLIHLNTDLAHFPEAYALGREALAALGLRIPAKFQPPAFLADLAHNRMLFRNRKIESIVDLPAATDELHIARIALLAAIGKAAYQIRPELCIAIMLKIVNASVRLGNTPDSTIGYMAVGAIFLGGILGRFKAGYEFGQASLKLVDRYDAARVRAEVNFVVGYFGTPWQRPALEAEALWKIAYRSGLDTGDLFHTGCASCATIMSQFIRGVPFEQLERQADEYLEIVERYGLREPRSAILAVRRSVNALANPRTGQLAPPAAEEEFGSRHIAHYAVLAKLQEQYLFGEYDAALETAQRSAKYLSDSRGMLHRTEHPFYLALVQMALLRNRPAALRLVPLLRLRREVNRFAKWARNSPENFYARALLLHGEHASVAGREDAALAAFDEAAKIALEYGQPHLAALAHRLAAEECARRRRAELQNEHNARAAELYHRWGAHGVAATLLNSPEPSLATRSTSA